MRTIAKLLLSSLVLAPSLAPSVASAEGRLEAGVTVGGHVFSDNSELGVPDLMGGASPQSSGMLGGRLGYAFLEQFIGEVELVLVPTVDDEKSGATAVFGLRGQVRYEPFSDRLMGGKLHPFLLVGYGAMAVRTDSTELEDDADQSYEWGLGTRYQLSSSMALRFDARHLLLPDRSKNGATSNFEFSAGLSWHFGPDRRALATREVVAGSPGLITPAPSSGAAGATGGGASAGATAGPAVSGGAVATVSAAPTTPPPPPPAARVEAPPANPDTDRDGVLYPQDLCPKEVEDRDGFRDDDGCPDPDNDGDGVADGNDRCVGDAETINGYTDSDGCPDSQHPEMAAVPFVRGSLGFTAESAASLDKTFQVLQQNPAFRVEIGGHSSSDESSRALSLRRAEAVKAYLVHRGIQEGRLRVLGYRDEQPVSADRSSAGRAKNRRVELRLLPLEAAK